MSGIKHDTGKPQLELLPTRALTEVGKVMTFGAKKYAPNNWRGGFAWTRILGSTLRHLFAWAGGEDVDPETGLSHLSHAATNVLFLIEMEQTNTGTDDRYRYDNSDTTEQSS